jgi:hypothetical protein
MKSRPLLLLLLVFACLNLQAQDKKLFSAEFQNTPAAKLLGQLESGSNYQFFYNAAELDSLLVTVSVKQGTIEAVLDQAFTNTDFHYAIDRQNRVFLTRKIPIITSLPPEFFGKAKQDTKLPANKSLLDLSTDKDIVKGTIENKLYEIGSKNTPRAGKSVVSGYVRNSNSGEPVINASVFVDKLNTGVTTDQYGYYTFTVPPGNHVFNVQATGMRDAKFHVVVYGEGKLDMELKEQIATLKEVTISTQKASNIRRVQLGVERLNIATIKVVPTVFGEADILRVVTTLPGVKTVGEASTGFNVRGGSADQNLILFNETTVYNPSHFFGMFSAFNPEIIKDIELYKSSIPAKYGGRLSSVLDISARDGNKKEFTGSAGLGLITTRLNLEGPIVKDKTSFIAGARTTYANWLLKFLPDPYNDSKASFNDGNLLVNHRMNQNNDFYLTGYLSNDRFNLASDTTYSYSNRNLSFKWRHNFSSKLVAAFVTGFDQYSFGISGEKNKVNAYTLSFDINQKNFKTDWTYSLNGSHSLGFGLSSIFYKLLPGSMTPRGSESLVKADEVPAEQAIESGIYLSDQFSVSSNFSVNAGLRFSLYNNLGPKELNIYADHLPKTEQTITGKQSFGKGAITKTYSAPEYRLSLRYAISNSFSVKAGYNSLNQYIHVLSNTSAIAPTDIWKLSDPNIRPQKGDQVSLGFYKNIKANTIETSMEVYYKRIEDYLDYKPGASLVLNHHIETDVINTQGKAYGLELMLKKPVGKFNGWISYTYSRILLKMDDSTVGAPVNRGEYYPANYDKPHDLTMVWNFKANHRFSVSWNMNYSTGRPITLPVGRFYYAGGQRVLYSDRNAYRIPDYFRTDIAMNIDGNHKVKQKTHNSWTIGVYNLTGKRNPFSVYYVTENGQVNGYKLSIFGNAIPFVNFNIRF